MSGANSAAQFVPVRLLAFLPPDDGTAQLSGAVLTADLSNFTGLTEALAKKAGAEGAELVSRELNQAFGPAIDAVMRQGGEVVKFSGDGLLCVFLGGDEACGRAQRAATEIAGAVVRGPGGELHQFRLAIAFGAITLARMGGHRARSELVAGGAAVECAQVLVAQGVAGTVPAAVRLEAIDVFPVPAQAWLHEPLDFLPGFVRDRLDGKFSQWLRELRTLSILFVAGDVAAAGVAVQEQAHAIQSAIDAQGGQLLRFSIEASRLVAEAVFGLSVGAASTGPREALLCGAELAQRYPFMHAGVSTGRLFLGPIGSMERRQLTALGSPVNLAARLMQHAAAGEVLADEVTWAAGGARFLGRLDRAELKGLGPRSFWRFGGASSAIVPADDGFFGREQEMEAIGAWLDDATGVPIVVEGEAGIGKSCVCQRTEGELRQRGIAVWTTVATAVGRDTPYSGLRSVLLTLCELDGSAAAEPALRATARRILGSADRAPLLGDALGLSMPDTPETRTLAGQVRAENIREVLVALLRARVAAESCALVVDDAHWLDSASWALLKRVAGEVAALRLVIFTRPLNPEPAELRAIVSQGAAVLELRPLVPQAITAVVARRLAARDVPDGIAQWVVDRARGNPFFARELAATLVSAGNVEVRDGAFASVPDDAQLEALPAVATIESALEQRIERLGLQDAIALKVASVIGPTFEIEAMTELSAAPDIVASMARLVATDMAVVVGPGRYAFRHRYTQEAAYRMLPSDQRRRLHVGVAGWLETRLGERAEERAGELAHHWFEAAVRPKAAQWLELAGARALRTGADREAAAHFRKALSIADEQTAGRRASWHRQLARALFGLGEVQGVAVEARRAVELVARALPDSVAGWAWMTARTVAGRFLGLSSLRQTRSRLGPDLLEGARAAGLLAEAAYFFNAPETVLGSALVAVELAERAKDAAPVSVAYGTLGVLAGMCRLHRTALRYLARARELSIAAGDTYQLGVAWFYEGMYFGCIGDWERSLRATYEALDLTERIGAHMQSGFQLTLIATNALYTSEYAKTRAWIETVRTRAALMANEQQLGWACNVGAVADLHQSRYADAIALTDRSRQIFVVERDLISLSIAEGVQCRALARLGRLDEALAGADRLTALIAQARPTTWGQLEGYAGPCEVYAQAIAQGVLAPREARERLRIAMTGLRQFAFVFPFGRPRLRWIQGLLANAHGERRNARRRLRQAIVLARRWRMPYEEMVAGEHLALLVEGLERTSLEARTAILRRQVHDLPEQAQAAVQAF